VHLAHFGDKTNAYRILVGNPEGKSLLRKPKRKWEDDFKLDARETGLGYGPDASGLE
jgi:hypothetical protein